LFGERPKDPQAWNSFLKPFGRVPNALHVSVQAEMEKNIFPLVKISPVVVRQEFSRGPKRGGSGGVGVNTIIDSVQQEDCP
jgi:hypothetical protein